MKRTIELKHVGPKEHVRTLIEELADRVEAHLRHFPDGVTSLHVLFDENGSHKLYRTAVTCHLPGHMVAAHEENRDAGLSIRKAFAELKRQLDKKSALLRREHLRKQSSQRRTSQPPEIETFSIDHVPGVDAFRPEL